jgi:pyruvate dehydrogenase E2 component (dihydrolipoamide acetyltransferase)
MGSFIVMPQLGLTMEKGTIVAWRKAEGDRVEEGEVLLEVETDKIVNEVTSKSSGVVLKVLVEEGEEVSVRTPLAVIGEPQEDIGEMLESAKREHSMEEMEDESAVDGSIQRREPGGSPAVGGRAGAGGAGAPAAPGSRRLTPRAKRWLSQQGISPSTLDGLHKSRITEADAKAFLYGSQETGEPKDHLTPFNRGQRVLIDRLVRSNRDIPKFSMALEIEMDRPMKILPQLSQAAGLKITVNDLILRAATLAIARCPEIQSQYRSEGVFHPQVINMGLAVSRGSELIAPVIRGAEKMKLHDISREAKRLVAGARNNSLTLDEVTGGTFTVSNLGMFGITSFEPIINPGEGAILGIGAVRELPRVREGRVVATGVMELTLVCDHRSVNGVAGARFCQIIKELLETEEISSW